MGEPIDFLNRIRNTSITVPIVYNHDTDFSNITNVLLVDSSVKDYNKFVENCNSSTFPITFSRGSKGQDIVDLLASKLPSISRIAIVADNSQMSASKGLFSYKPYFLDSDLVEGVTSYSENVKLIIDLVKTHSVKNIDFLACYSLSYDNWKSYYSILTKETGVVVGASNDETGNLNYGGDWTLESTGVDIEAIYFTSGISNYQGTLVTTSSILGTTGTNPGGIAIDSAGNVYTNNRDSNNVTKITPAGVSSILGTTGTNPSGIAIDSAGNVYTANGGNNNVTKITPAGVSSIFGTTGTNPSGIAIDSAGNVYTSNFGSNNVTKITPSGVSSIFGNTGTGPNSIAIDSVGNVYTANSNSNNVTKITPAGVSSILGTTDTTPAGIAIDSAGNVYTANYNSNNVTKITPAGVSSIFGTTGTGPIFITIDSSGNVYTSNLDSNNVTKITPSGTSSILGTTGNYPLGIAIDSAGNVYTANAGSNNVTKITPGSTSSILGTTGTNPVGIAIDSAGNVYTANLNSNNVTKISPSGTSSILGKTGTGPGKIAIDSSGNVYTNNRDSNNVTKITPSGTSSILGTTGNNPLGIAIDSAGNVYTANVNSNNVTKITPAGVSSILGTTGNNPGGIAIDSVGNVYTANSGSNNVTKITPSGVSSIFGTTGTTPNDIAIDSAGNVYTANYNSNNVTKIPPSGGTGTIFGTTGTGPIGIAIDSAGNVYTANFNNNNVTKITPSGVSSILGTTGNIPIFITIDPSGNLYTSNFVSNDVTKITLDSYPAPPNTASAPSAVVLNGAVMVTINVNSISGRYGAPSSYLVRAVEDNSKSCVIGYLGPGPISGIINGFKSGQSYTFETIARLGTWNAKPSLPSSAVIPVPNTTTTTTTTTTTLPPNKYTNVQFSISAPFTLVDTETSMAEYMINFIDRVVFYTGAPRETITVTSVTPGSIVNQLRLPSKYVPHLQYVVQTGLFQITIDGLIYQAIASSFIILDNICFRRGTMILTPGGYRSVESLNSGDLLKTAQGRVTQIQGVTSFFGSREKCPLYVLQKGSLGFNTPIMDLYMSEGHAYRKEGRWCHMKCSSVAMKLDEDNIEYYNIALDNYLEHTLVANGVEVESLFKIPGLKMNWNCSTDNCMPVITKNK